MVMGFAKPGGCFFFLESACFCFCTSASASREVHYRTSASLALRIARNENQGAQLGYIELV